MRLHVVGNACLDTTFSLRHLPQPGETVNGMLSAEGAGGKGANQAVAAARIGAEVCLHAAIGSDLAAEQLVQLLRQDLATERLVRMAIATDRSTILVDSAGENVVISAVACATTFDPTLDADLAKSLHAGDTVLMQGNLAPDVTLACLSLARRCGVRTIFNPSPLWPDASVNFSTIDLAIANREEAAALAGTRDMQEAIRALVRRGAASAIVTLGADGCLILEAPDADIRHHAAPKVEACDTSGAGDCFAGTVAGLVTLGKTLAFSAAVATETSARAVCRPGTIASFPSRAEFAAILKTFELERA